MFLYLFNISQQYYLSVLIIRFYQLISVIFNHIDAFLAFILLLFLFMLLLFSPQSLFPLLPHLPLLFIHLHHTHLTITRYHISLYQVHLSTGFVVLLLLRPHQKSIRICYFQWSFILVQPSLSILRFRIKGEVGI